MEDSTAIFITKSSNHYYHSGPGRLRKSG